jgi:hypothetical protein
VDGLWTTSASLTCEDSGGLKARTLYALVALPLLVAACSPTAATPATSIPPPPSVPIGPPDTGATAAPADATFACRELTAAASLLMSGTGFAQAASWSRTGLAFATASAAHDPAYVKLSNDARSLAAFAARRTLLLLLSGGNLGGSKPTNVAPMRAVERDCS